MSEHIQKTLLNRVMQHRASYRVRQRGASLLEAVAYLGVAAIVVIGAIALLRSSFSSASANGLSEQVNAIQSGVKKLYMGQGAGYSGISIGVLASAGGLPSTLTTTTSGTDSSATTVSNAWGGTVELTAASSNNGFNIFYTQVPQDVCINALTSGGSWSSITVNSETISTFPVSPSVAASDCTTENSITWVSI